MMTMMMMTAIIRCNKGSCDDNIEVVRISGTVGIRKRELLEDYVTNAKQCSFLITLIDKYQQQQIYFHEGFKTLDTYEKKS